MTSTSTKTMVGFDTPTPAAEHTTDDKFRSATGPTIHRDIIGLANALQDLKRQKSGELSEDSPQFLAAYDKVLSYVTQIVGYRRPSWSWPLIDAVGSDITSKIWESRRIPDEFNGGDISAGSWCNVVVGRHLIKVTEKESKQPQVFGIQEKIYEYIDPETPVDTASLNELTDFFQKLLNDSKRPASLKFAIKFVLSGAPDSTEATNKFYDHAEATTGKTRNALFVNVHRGLEHLKKAIMDELPSKTIPEE